MSKTKLLNELDLFQEQTMISLTVEHRLKLQELCLISNAYK